MKPTIEPMGDSAVIVAWRLLDEATAWHAVRNAVKYLEDNHIEGVLSLAPAFKSLTVYYNCENVAWTEVEKWIVEALPLVPPALNGTRRIIEVPVCYDLEFALDINVVAAAHDLSPDDVIRLHSNAEYTVQMIGFMPGFPYLAGLPPQLQMPRRVSPRLHVPAGSVAIGGTQTGIYSCETPGGWNVIGRTPLVLFDPQRHPPCLLRAGDTIQFIPMDRKQFSDYPEPA